MRMTAGRAVPICQAHARVALRAWKVVIAMMAKRRKLAREAVVTASTPFMPPRASSRERATTRSDVSA
jgi:hypothetical protein